MAMSLKPPHPWKVYNGMGQSLWTACLVEAKEPFYDISMLEKETACSVERSPPPLQKHDGWR